MQNKNTFIFALLFLAFLVALFFYQSQVNLMNKRLAVLENQLVALGTQLEVVISESGKSASNISEITQELERRNSIREKFQDELLTVAVAQATPSVVSIVITKDVPKLEVVYVNPFGNDPFFKDVGIRVPTYQQKGTEKQKVGAGTGFFVSSNGYIVTNNHVVSDTSATYTVLLSSGQQKTAQVVYKDSKLDIAVIKIAGSGYSKLDLGASSSLKLGQAVFAVGNALGEYNNSISVGIISGLNRDLQASDKAGGNVETLSGVIQTDAAINPGNSGGPLVDLNGQVVGVNVATVLGSQSIGFSIPVDKIKPIVNSVVK